MSPWNILEFVFFFLSFFFFIARANPQLQTKCPFSTLAFISFPAPPLLPRPASRLCLANSARRSASTSALADLAASRFAAFCRCFFVSVSGALDEVEVILEVEVVDAFVLGGPVSEERNREKRSEDDDDDEGTVHLLDRRLLTIPHPPSSSSPSASSASAPSPSRFLIPDPDASTSS